MATSFRIAAALAALMLVSAACGSSSSSSPNGASQAQGTGVVRSNAGSLVDRSGMTLYALSAETHGRFICTMAKLPGTTTPCVSVWHPLLVGSPQALGTGVPHLGTIHRPGDAQMQVTFDGRPLYTFAGDKASGDAAGNGLKDVGTWHAATLGGASGQSQSAAAPTYGGY